MCSYFWSFPFSVTQTSFDLFIQLLVSCILVTVFFSICNSALINWNRQVFSFFFADKLTRYPFWWRSQKSKTAEKRKQKMDQGKKMQKRGLNSQTCKLKNRWNWERIKNRFRFSCGCPITSLEHSNWTGNIPSWSSTTSPWFARDSAERMNPSCPAAASFAREKQMVASLADWWVSAIPTVPPMVHWLGPNLRNLHRVRIEFFAPGLESEESQLESWANDILGDCWRDEADWSVLEERWLADEDDGLWWRFWRENNQQQHEGCREAVRRNRKPPNRRYIFASDCRCSLHTSRLRSFEDCTKGRKMRFTMRKTEVKHRYWSIPSTQKQNQSKLTQAFAWVLISCPSRYSWRQLDDDDGSFRTLMPMTPCVRNPRMRTQKQSDDQTCLKLTNTMNRCVTDSQMLRSTGKKVDESDICHSAFVLVPIATRNDA